MLWDGTFFNRRTIILVETFWLGHMDRSPKSLLCEKGTLSGMKVSAFLHETLLRLFGLDIWIEVQSLYFVKREIYWE